MFPLSKVSGAKYSNTFMRQVEKELGYPCFVKPANLGSSVGISKCTNRAELETGFHGSFPI